MIELPEELQGRDVKIVHYHSADDISVIVKGDEARIGTYIITEEGYLVTQINKFSNFSLIYEETCLAHWFMITAAVLNILLIAAVIIMGKKQSKAVGISAVVGLAVISGVSAIFAHCMICWIMLGINGGLILFDILFFAMWKGKGEPEQPQSVQQVISQQVAAPVAAPVLSLSQSIAKASVLENEGLFVTKQIVSQYLSDNYSEDVTLNRKPNYTSTNLPLADAHYVKVSDTKKLCFIYVYELNNNKSFFIVRTSKAIYEAIKAKHPVIELSAFPKAVDDNMWYTVMFDSSYKTLEDVYEVIDMVLGGFMANNKAPASVVEPEPVVEAPVEVEDENSINYMYKFSFSARLIRAGDKKQEFYNEVKNEFLSYKKVASKVSWGHELFKLGRIKLGQLKVKGKTLCVYLPLDPSKYDKERLFYKETGDEEFPLMLQVKSDRGVKYAKELIAEVMSLNGINKLDNYEPVDYKLPYMSIEEMLVSNPVLAKRVDGVVPVVEAKPESVKEEPTPVVEEAPVVEEVNDGIEYNYKFSFSARLIRAGADRQEFYNAVKNEFLAYKKVGNKVSWGHELFKLGRVKLGELKVKGKTLCVYLPLDPALHDQDRLHFKETGNEEFPLMMKVTSDRAVKYVAELIAEVMTANELPRIEDYAEVDYRLPEMTIEEMLKADPPLAKENDSKVSFGK